MIPGTLWTKAFDNDMGFMVPVKSFKGKNKSEIIARTHVTSAVKTLLERILHSYLGGV